MRATLNSHLLNLTEAEANIRRAKRISSDSAELNYVEALFYTSAGSQELALDKVLSSLQDGYGIEWFSFTWFSKLCTTDGFQNLFIEAGQKPPCSASDRNTNLVE